jgi:hypothetical protein
MYVKGRSFVKAATLLREENGYEYVVLHLLCQGVEVTLKALLLFKDYNHFKPQLRKPIGHDLEAVVAAVQAAYELRPMRSKLASELNRLNVLYRQHLLRYGNGFDILVDPRTIESARVLRRIRAVIRITDRVLYEWLRVETD